tara:strand:- start:239 stop:814 length:576 start_codon:yes stop_codon:yes gene_type:complete
MNSWYICLEPGSEDIVDKFIGTEENVLLRSRTLEFVRLDPGLHPDYIKVSRDAENNNVVIVEEVEQDDNDNVVIGDCIRDSYSLRQKRDIILRKSDWVVSVSDLTLSPEEFEAWKVYRQALRDLPANTIDPENPPWPEPFKLEITNKTSTKTQLQAEKIENEITRLKLANAESRISILEQSISSILSKLNV